MASSLEQTPKEETTNLSRPPESPDTPTSISLISSLHTLTITPSAASRALNIPELLETILLLLSSTFHDLVFEHPTYTLNSEPLYHLLALCRVSKFWHNVIMNSTRFREPLFLHPIPKPADTVTDADDTDAAYQKCVNAARKDLNPILSSWDQGNQRHRDFRLEANLGSTRFFKAIEAREELPRTMRGCW